MHTSDEMLDYLAQFGRPRLSRQDDGGWFAMIVLPAPEGVSMECKSDFGHSSHSSALQQLVARLDSMATALAPVKSGHLRIVEGR